MSKSTVGFTRWVSRERSTWPLQVFRKYNHELNLLYCAHLASSANVYAHLGSVGAEWNDRAEKHLDFLAAKERVTLFGNLKDWSESANVFENWVRLNVIVAIASNLETYMAAVIQLAIDSDPGLLIGASKAVDGVSLLKRDVTQIGAEAVITDCTRGSWSSRVAAYSGAFGEAPKRLFENISELDAMRRLRNDVGHAFGRDIERARMHGTKEIIPMQPLSKQRADKLQNIAMETAKAIDSHLLRHHVGEYQAVHFYHKMFPALRKDVHGNQRAVFLKKELGRFKAQLAGKTFCNALVAYYEAL